LDVVIINIQLPFIQKCSGHADLLGWVRGRTVAGTGPLEPALPPTPPAAESAPHASGWWGSISTMIEAPWLGNGGHGASLRQPGWWGASPWEWNAGPGGGQIQRSGLTPACSAACTPATSPRLAASWMGSIGPREPARGVGEEEGAGPNPPQKPLGMKENPGFDRCWRDCTLHPRGFSIIILSYQ
jgi:hypothetical protein